jgi:hypothetical protein
MASGALDWSVGASMAFFLALKCSFWFLGVLGVEVGGARDGSWRCCLTTGLYLATKPSHVGVNVDRLAYPVHRPMALSYQMMGHGLAARHCLIMSLQWAVVTF